MSNDAPAPLPAKLSELDNLRLRLAKERQARLSTEAQNLAMAQARHASELQGAALEDKELFARLRAEYRLEGADELLEDGTIKRAPVRQLKKEA